MLHVRFMDIKQHIKFCLQSTLCNTHTKGEAFGHCRLKFPRHRPNSIYKRLVVLLLFLSAAAQLYFSPLLLIAALHSFVFAKDEYQAAVRVSSCVLSKILDVLVLISSLLIPLSGGREDGSVVHTFYLAYISGILSWNSACFIHLLDCFLSNV